MVEIQSYKEKPLLFWEKYKFDKEFFYLIKYVQWHCAATGTQAMVERSFKYNKNILTKTKNRTNPSYVEHHNRSSQSLSFDTKLDIDTFKALHGPVFQTDFLWGLNMQQFDVYGNLRRNNDDDDIPLIDISNIAENTNNRKGGNHNISEPQQQQQDVPGILINFDDDANQTNLGRGKKRSLHTMLVENENEGEDEDMDQDQDIANIENEPPRKKQRRQ